MNTVKKIVSVLLLFSGLGGLIRKDFIPAFLLIVLGVLLYPTISSKIKENFKPWNNKVVRYGAYFLIFIISGAFISSKDNSSTNSNNLFTSSKSNSKYSSYNQQTLDNISKLSDKLKESRDTTLTQLKSTQTYKDLVINKVVTKEYLPTLTLINNCIKGIYKDANGDYACIFYLSLVDEVDKSLKNKKYDFEKGSDKIRFTDYITKLAAPSLGGLPVEVVEIFERYKKRYNVFGKPSTVYNTETKQSESIEKPYDMTGVFTLFQPNNKKILNKLYEANTSVSSWFSSKNNEILYYPFLGTLKGYKKHVRNVYPESPYVLNVDAELTANQLYNAYNENEIAADKKYKNKKLAVTGIISEISEIWGKVTVDLKVGGRFEFTTIKSSIDDKDVVASLRKGQKITVIGTCDGLTANLYIGLNDCKLWNN